MSTVKRRLFNVLAAGSLALCLAMLGLWVNSRWRHDAIGRSSEGRNPDLYSLRGWSLHSNNGMLALHGVALGPIAPVDLDWSPPSWRWSSERAYGSGPHLLYCRNADGRVLGFVFVRAEQKFPPGNFTASSVGPYIAREKLVSVPHWLLALILAILPARWLLLLWRRRHNSPKHACPTCGYDLRATPERCPECGLLVKPTA
jgi:hypothetical protein